MNDRKKFYLTVDERELLQDLLLRDASSIEKELPKAIGPKIVDLAEANIQMRRTLASLFSVSESEKM